MWSLQAKLSQYDYIVLDADSIVTSLFRECMTNHIRRLRSINKPVDLYSATLINYREFARYISLLLEFFQNRHIVPIIIYEGKFMEAPIYGLLAAEFTKNTQQVVGRVAMNQLYDKRDSFLDPVNHLSRPNLALNVFKSVVNAHQQNGATIKVYNAFYSAYPLMAKAARDYSCPVLTNNCDFILMDVRAGFLLFEEFWRQLVGLDNQVTREQSKSHSSKKSLKSDTKSAAKSARSRSQLSHKFYSNSLFLHQHPGLNAPSALHLFPLTSVDFITKYPKSLKRLQVYDREYGQADLIFKEGPDNSKQIYSIHHKAANRFEMAMKFLSNKTLDIVGSQIRSEAERTKTGFDDDYRQLFNYYSVAYDFKLKLRFTLKYITDPALLYYIERCLVERECSAEWLLVLLCCSMGRLASVGYNRHIQFEDLATKRSAYSILNEIKSMFMSLFSGNKSHKSEHSLSLSNRQRDTVTRYPTASLTLIDRVQSRVVEQNVPATCENPQLDQLRTKLQLIETLGHNINKQDSAEFLNLAFKSTNLLQFASRKMDELATKYIIDNQVRNELAIILSLFQFITQSINSSDDKYAKEVYSKSLFQHFELATLNHYLYADQLVCKASSGPDLVTLVNLINGLHFENVCITSTVNETKSSKTNSKQDLKRRKKSLSSQSETSNKASDDISKRIRHLIEMLNTSIEGYLELNAFFEYPSPKLMIHQNYNPILLYNLTLYSINNPNNKVMLGH